MNLTKPMWDLNEILRINGINQRVPEYWDCAELDNNLWFSLDHDGSIIEVHIRSYPTPEGNKFDSLVILTLIENEGFNHDLMSFWLLHKTFEERWIKFWDEYITRWDEISCAIEDTIEEGE